MSACNITFYIIFITRQDLACKPVEIFSRKITFSFNIRKEAYKYKTGKCYQNQTLGLKSIFNIQLFKHKLPKLYYGMARSQAFCIREDFKKRFTFLKTNIQYHHIPNGRINEEPPLL